MKSNSFLSVAKTLGLFKKSSGFLFLLIKKCLFLRFYTSFSMVSIQE